MSSLPPTRRSHYSVSSDGRGSENVPGSGSTPSTAGPPNAEARLRNPRSLPPWIDSYEERYGPVKKDQLDLLHPPVSTRRPHHNSTPSEPQRRVSQDGFVDVEDTQLGPARGPRGSIPHILRYGRAPKRGRKWDHLRSAEPVVVASYVASSMYAPPMAWNEFVRSSKYGNGIGEKNEILEYSDLEKLQPNFNRPVRGAYNPLDLRLLSKRKRAVAPYKRVWNLVMRHPFSPLTFRMLVMITSILALGIAGRIHYKEQVRDDDDIAEQDQSIMAIVVDCIAVPYIAYMIWDEYTGKPLGLRSVRSKMSLILLDLVFIIFKSGSTALAFQSLVIHGIGATQLQALTKALAAFMLLGLISWTITFIINIFRTVERLGGGDDDERG